MNRIDKQLPNHICRTCDNLTYWDWYICKKDKHTTKDGFLNKRKLRKCSEYIERIGNHYKLCKDVKCVFWCNDCEAYEIPKYQY